MKFGRDVDIAILDVGPIDFLFEAVATDISCDGQSKWVPETVILRSSSNENRTYPPALSQDEQLRFGTKAHLLEPLENLLNPRLMHPKSLQ